MPDKNRIFNNAVDRALQEGFVLRDKIEYYNRRNMPLPEYLKPGALLRWLSPEHREILVDLTSDDVRHLGLRSRFLW